MVGRIEMPVDEGSAVQPFTQQAKCASTARLCGGGIPEAVPAHVGRALGNMRDRPELGLRQTRSVSQRALRWAVPQASRTRNGKLW
jgi:hypothetical protein